MLLTVFLAIVLCGAVTLMLISGVAFVQDNVPVTTGDGD